MNNQARWGSHDRGIDRDVLTELGLRIDSLEDDQMLSDLAKKYFWFFRDFAYKTQQPNVVHSRNYF